MSAVRPRAIDAARYGERLRAAQERIRAEDVAALLVGVGADLRWLTGYAAMPLERLTLLVLPSTGDPALIVPRLEIAPARLAPAVTAGFVRPVTWEETDDPFALVPGLVAGGGGRTASSSTGRGADGTPGRLLVSDRLPAASLLRLQASFPATDFGLASRVLRELRMVKDAAEVELLRAAARAADRVIEALARGRLVGRTEEQVAREVRERLVQEGHEAASFSIVGSGPNSASPHHSASSRVIEAGEPIVLDIGGTLDGYGSDVTRTLWVTGGDPSRAPHPEFRALYDVLQRAQAEAVAAARPGVSCESIDRAARACITAAGYGQHFMHRTGHGIGLEEHEDPYIVEGNARALQPGHAFSIEPGIYLEGRFGARIEDIVVCGPDGAESLNELSRELLVVDG